MNRGDLWAMEQQGWRFRPPTEEVLYVANEALANEVVDLHARLRAYENTAGDTARAQRLEELLKDCIDTLTWLASGNEMCYAHDVDVIARDFRGRLDQMNAGGDDDV